MILLDASGVAATRPGRPLLTDVSVTVSTGDRLGVVGLNGCGKSTLLRILAGATEPEAGAVRRGKDVRVAVLDQTDDVPGDCTVRESLVAGLDVPTWEAEAIADRNAAVPVRLADERLTTVSAARSLREAGVRARNQRGMIDQAAAVEILQGWLDQRRNAAPTC